MGPPNARVQKVYAGPEDWETHRETITRLYLHDKLSLQQVMENMAADHLFFATCESWTMPVVADAGANQPLQSQDVQNADQEMGD